MLGGRIDERLRGALKDKGRPGSGRTRKGVDRRWAGAAAGVAGLLAVGVSAWVLWPSPEVEPRPREYADVTACLLTDGGGIAGERVAPVWAGMTAASERTRGQVRYLEVTGDQTVDNAKTFVGTLVLGRCAVIVAAPGIADEAVRALVDTYQQQKFLVVGGAEPRAGNLSRVEPAEVESAVGERLAPGR